MSIEGILSQIRRHEQRRLRWWLAAVIGIWFGLWLYSCLSFPALVTYEWTESEAEALLSLLYPVDL